MPQFWHDAEHQVKTVAEMAHEAQLYLHMNINQTVTQTTALSAIASAVLTISTFTLMLTLSSNISIACDIVPADSQRTMKWKMITIPLDPIMKTNSNEWECSFSTPLPSSFLKPHMSYNILP